MQLLTSKDALTRWWNSLPTDVVDGRSQSPQHARSSMHLQLEYCLVRMFIGRPFMLKKETSNLVDGFPSHLDVDAARNQASSHGEAQEYTSGHGDLIKDCINAAIEALEICQELRDGGPGLARASYVEYSSCRVSLLVLIAYSIQSFSEQYRKPLREGLDMIREMSAVGESAQSEVALIETLERALAQLHTGRRRAQYNEVSGQAGSSVSEYEAFKQWGANLRKSEMLNTSILPTVTSNSQAGKRGLPSGCPSDLPFHFHDDAPRVDHSGPSFSVTSREVNSGLLDPFDTAIGPSIFGAENSSPSVGWPTWTEAQVLGQFLADPH